MRRRLGRRDADHVEAELARRRAHPLRSLALVHAASVSLAGARWPATLPRAVPPESSMDRLVFLIGAPRSGSTLLARMLGSHSAIFAPAEPHLMPPLAHLGFHERVDQAPYDPVITQQGLRSFVALLPGGESDWLAALRRATDHLYERALAPSGRRLFLDKTPAYALVLDFLVKLHPDARYIVLTRHPLAVWYSHVESFFDGDAAAAHARNPLLERYVPAIARFLRERPVPLHHVRYEALVTEPEPALRAICAYLGVDFEPGMIEYGSAEEAAPRAGRGLGDPVTVNRESRPTTRSVGKWAEALARRPGAPRAVPGDRGAAQRRGSRGLGGARARAPEGARRAHAGRARGPAGVSSPATRSSGASSCGSAATSRRTRSGGWSGACAPSATCCSAESADGRRDLGPGATTPDMPTDPSTASQAVPASRWEAPRVEVISLSCEITAYAPDGEPLF